jgi:hypothetical protein
MVMASSHERPRRDKSFGTSPPDSAVLVGAAIGLAGLGLLALTRPRPLLAVVPFGMTAALGMRAFRLNEARSRWLRTGMRTSAEVVETARQWWPIRDGYHGQLVVKYQYDAEGATRSGEDVPVACWKPKPKPGDQIEILYDPGDPDVSAWFDDLPAAPPGTVERPVASIPQ